MEIIIFNRIQNYFIDYSLIIFVYFIRLNSNFTMLHYQHVRLNRMLFLAIATRR